MRDAMPQKTIFVVTEEELANTNKLPPEGWVRCPLRQVWVPPELLKAERRDTRPEDRVFV